MDLASVLGELQPSVLPCDRFAWRESERLSVRQMIKLMRDWLPFAADNDDNFQWQPPEEPTSESESENDEWAKREHERVNCCLSSSVDLCKLAACCRLLSRLVVCCPLAVKREVLCKTSERKLSLSHF